MPTAVHVLPRAVDGRGARREPLARPPGYACSPKGHARSSLDMRIRTEVGRILASRNVNPQAKDLDRKRLGRTNFVVLKATIDNHVNQAVRRTTGERHDFTRQELETIDAQFNQLVQAAVQEVFYA